MRSEYMHGEQVCKQHTIKGPWCLHATLLLVHKPTHVEARGGPSMTQFPSARISPGAFSSHSHTWPAGPKDPSLLVHPQH